MEDPIHNQLRTLRDGVIDAFNKKDIDRLLEYLTKDVVVTWQNAQVSKGREAVKAYYQRMMTEVVDSVDAQPEVDELSILYSGNTAIAWGKLNDHYKLKDGTEFNLNSRFSVTAIKDGETWRIGSYHASTNTFDNEVLNYGVRKASRWAGGLGILGGLLVGIAGTRIVMRLRKRPT